MVACVILVPVTRATSRGARARGVVCLCTCLESTALEVGICGWLQQRHVAAGGGCEQRVQEQSRSAHFWRQTFFTRKPLMRIAGFSEVDSKIQKLARFFSTLHETARIC
eukprot:2538630-Prymnesium_polylepis.2